MVRVHSSRLINLVDKTARFVYFISMKKKIALLYLLLFFSLSSAFSGVFTNYDFTFYKTISQTLTVFDANKIGFDYTGFGFVGKSKRTGLFVRFGFQTPFSFPSSDNKSNSSSNETKEEESSTSSNNGSSSSSTPPLSELVTSTPGYSKKNDDISIKTFSFTSIMGPAARIITTNFLNAYFGIGIRVSQDITITTEPVYNRTTTNSKTSIGIDFDIGGKVDLTKRTSIRIGIYATSTLMSFTTVKIASVVDGEQMQYTDYPTVFFDILNPKRKVAPLVTHAYISMGTHFSSNWKKQKYQYIITSSKLFSGTLVALN